MVGEKDSSKIQDLKNIAKSMDINLNETTIAILQNSKYSGHIAENKLLNKPLKSNTVCG